MPVFWSLRVRASWSGCCARLSTTSFQSSRSWRTRSSCDSMCCCEICRSRRTEWSAFFPTRSRTLLYFCQNMVPRVEKAWRQLSSQKFRSVLDLVSKKADHSVLRLLQISQQHIESQLDRVRHERELWKEVVDKRAQQPLQLALTLKDQNSGMPLGGAVQPGMTGMNPMFAQPSSAEGPRMMPASVPMGPAGSGMPPESPGGAMKPSPLAKRIAKPAGAPPTK